MLTAPETANRSFYAHNGGNYDVMPIIEELVRRKVFPKMINAARSVIRAVVPHSEKQGARVTFKVRPRSLSAPSPVAMLRRTRTNTS